MHNYYSGSVIGLSLQIQQGSAGIKSINNLFFPNLRLNIAEPIKYLPA